jgi:hypothetical protein
MKADELCKAFCGELSIRKVPAGFAVCTAFDDPTGDPIGFYIVGPEYGNYRLEDAGLLIPFIESTGADLKNATRMAALNELLEQYGVDYDEDTGELSTALMPEHQIPSAAIRFVALLLRVQDIIFMAAERAASTFREDALRLLKNKLGDRASIEEEGVIDPKLSDITVDAVIRAEGRKPVAVFFGVSDQKVNEAIFLQMTATYEAQVDCAVVALLEREASVSKKIRQRALNRLDAMPIFRGEEDHAITRVCREAIGMQAIH